MDKSAQLFLKNLNYHFRNAGWSQAEFGNQIGVSQGQARKYLQGISSPPFETLDKIASVFGIEVKDLFVKETIKSEVTVHPDKQICEQLIRILSSLTQKEKNLLIKITEGQAAIFKSVRK